MDQQPDTNSNILIQRTAPRRGSSFGPEAFLYAYENTLIRSEVEKSLNSILIDVEIAENLRIQLESKAHERETHSLRRQLNATIQETKLEISEIKEASPEMGDKLVKELVDLSREIDSLVAWKKSNEKKVKEYDNLVERLEEAEQKLENVNAAKSHAATTEAHSSPLKPMPSESLVTIAPDQDVESSNDAVPDESLPETKPTETEMTPTTSPGDAGGEDSTSAAPETAASNKIESLKDINDGEVEASGPPNEKISEVPSKSDESTTAEEEPGSSSPATVVALVEDEDEEEETPNLINLDVEILMNIFGFLDAFDILNTAQINVEMYSRVDSIFGIAGDGHEPPRPQPPAPASNTNKVSSSQPISGQPSQQQATGTSPSVQGTSSVQKEPESAAAALGKGLFSMLQPRGASSSASQPGRYPGQAQTAVKKENKKSAGLSATMAQSMAAKLSDTEIAAIISMTEKLSKMEKEYNRLRNEREEMQAKLDGTEAVKQFLIGKVRDAESKLNAIKEDETKVTKQISSDQEIIAFLDGRVQELEKTCDMLQKAKDSKENEYIEFEKANTQKVTVLSDVLKYEREKVRESESEWKATKKVLVKEVKSCRAQISALQAERDGLNEQNERLKRALTASGKSTSAPRSPKSTHY